MPRRQRPPVQCRTVCAILLVACAIVAAPLAASAGTGPASAYRYADPHELATDGVHVWVTNFFGNSVTELSNATGAVVEVIGAPSFRFDRPDAIATDGSDVWVANCDGNSVTEFSATTGDLIRVIGGKKFKLDHPVSISADSSHVWVTSASNDALTELSASTGDFVKVVEGTAFGFDDPEDVTTDGAHVWVVNEGGNSVTVLSDGSGGLVQLAAGQGFDFRRPAAVASDGLDVWVANTKGNSVTELSSSSGQLVANLDGPQYEFDGPCSITTDGVDVWVANCAGDSVTEFLASTGDLVGVVQGSSNGLHGPLSITNDGAHVWVANARSGSITKFPTGVPQPSTSSPYDGAFSGTPEPVGAMQRSDGDRSLPDPAGVDIGNGVAQLYATGSLTNGVPDGIATTTWTLGTDAVGRVTDALSSKPPPPDADGSWSTCNDWAPTVAKIDHRYVMWFSAQIGEGRRAHCASGRLRSPLHCLVYATSTSPSRGFEVRGNLCASDFVTASENGEAAATSQGLFDPTLFVGPITHDVYLLWSQETLSRGASSDCAGADPASSMIVGMEIERNGTLRFGGSPLRDRIVLTSLAAEQSLGSSSGYTLGSYCELENPQVVRDVAAAPPGGPVPFLLVTSLGSWHQMNAYHSFAELCATPVSGCAGGADAGVLDPYLDRAGGRALENLGGLSVINGTEGAARYVLFVGTVPGLVGPRPCYWETASTG